jgi:hypothetical protein
MKRGTLLLWLVVILSSSARAGGLLRNGDFQDDWQTLLPELKNHHWNYTTEVFNRRDYNPDGWRLSGKWQWLDADKPRGQRRLILSSPSKVVQSVNWVTVNNPKKLEGWPDAGGYPAAEAVRSKNPLALVRDLTFRLRLSATGVPAKGVTLTVAWNGASPIDDPLGSKRLVSASVAIPEGTYKDKTVEVTLPAATWLEAAKKDPAFAAQGALLPMAATCEIAYADKQAGSVELHDATLDDASPTSPNVLIPQWSKSRKYRYFSPGLYYIFNTWHNSNSDNRGTATNDRLVHHGGIESLRMDVPSGDEMCVVSEPMKLNQKEARLIEVRAWIKTDQLCMMQIDAEDEKGQRLDCFNFIHKNPLSIGTDDWRLVRQVFRPAAPLKSIRLKLCARGMNGYTLDDAGHQPQQNASGIIWWDDVTMHEVESLAAELKARGVRINDDKKYKATEPYLERLDLGERLLGENTLTAEIVNPGPTRKFKLVMSLTDKQLPELPSASVQVAKGGRKQVRLTYSLPATTSAYESYEPLLLLVVSSEKVPDTFEVARHRMMFLKFSPWTVPMDLELGALYLRPEQKQFVRVNLGLAYAEMAKLKELRLELLRRGSGEVVKTFTVPATLDAIEKQRAKIPDGLRDDFRNMVLTDLDVSFLPLQAFNDPQRNHVLKVTTIDKDGKPGWSMTSPPFCRLAHDGPQPAITSVKISKDGDFLVNDKPWMPWGVTYGHNPVYDGPADSGKYHDLANLKQWSLYDRHGGNLAERALWDGNCVRHVEGALVKRDQLEAIWKKNLYASTVFLPPLSAGKPWPADHLAYLKTAPMVAAVSRGPEEAFGYFTAMMPAQLDAVKKEVEQLRAATGKPVMTGHGGYWTRLEFEKVPFFDIYDPETEPWYPAPLHTDLRPLVEGKPQVVWLRPQMYESVPYERWRYHVFVELMRGARGWQLAHGPGDASTFRGLHAELRRLEPAIYSKEKPSDVSIQPGIEHMVRKHGGKTTIIAATTHGMSFGNWRWGENKFEHGRPRVTADPHVFRDESDGYHATGEPPLQTAVPHGIQNLIDPKKWPAGTKLTTWVKLDGGAMPKNLVALVKADGRWIHAASWGKWDLDALRKDNARSFWFLRTFYRHARGFLGWGDKVPAYALDYLPTKAEMMGELPAADKWVKLEVPLEKIGAAGKLLDGVGFLHDGGRVWWARTVLVPPEGKETVVFGDHEDRHSPEQLQEVKVTVAGLKKGTKIQILFEDRVIVAEDGYFVDDFRGVDLYQRYGGERSGYGNAPVALHIYEVPG